MTSVPWFRETLKESKKQLRMAIVLEAKLCWKQAIFRARRILQKRRSKNYET